ncbi:hypothetical protein LCGC14_0428200 [marine sediment metagenome]|uniref:Uncharacterized protein n=1 Tax=marine sediment metagenome TaxID=412755 RepID=A0A0F9SNP9_9ZZZZ
MDIDYPGKPIEDFDPCEEAGHPLTLENRCPCGAMTVTLGVTSDLAEYREFRIRDRNGKLVEIQVDGGE